MAYLKVRIVEGCHEALLHFVSGQVCDRLCKGSLRLAFSEADHVFLMVDEVLL